MRTTIRIEGLEELYRNLDQIGPELVGRIRTEMNAAAAGIANTVKDRIRDGSGDTLHSRTGQLRRSIRYGTTGNTLQTLRSEVYSDGSVASYAPVHELGATIRAKRAYAGLPGGPYLHFPIGANLTPAGVQRMTGREVFQRGAYVARNRSAAYPYRVVLNGETMFLLTKQVTIPPRLGMMDAVDEETPALMRRISEAVLGAIRA